MYENSRSEKDKKNLRKETKAAKNAFFKTIIQEIAASRKWNLLPWTGTRKYNLTHQLLDENKQAIPPRDTIKTLHNHFAGPGRSNPIWIS